MVTLDLGGFLLCLGCIMLCHGRVGLLSEIVTEVHHWGIILRYRGIILRKSIGEGCILLDQASIVWHGVITVAH